VNTTAGRPAQPPDFNLEAPAKVNLFLEVLGKRDDGYHRIETVMQAVDLCDTLEFWEGAPGQFSISVSGGPAPADETNLALRAARLLSAESGTGKGVHIHVHKRIPLGGGLGGGSSDAAAALRALNDLWKLACHREDLEALGTRLGSDVNFFLSGGAAICRGRGELVEPIIVSTPITYLLHVPQLQVATRDIYARLRMPLTGKPRMCTNICGALEHGDLEGVGAELYNRLEGPAFEAYPRLADAKRRMGARGAPGTLLSGSGSTVFAISDPGAAECLEAGLKGELRSGVLLAAKPISSWR
jgi:4-diphosphocytidyl-2-C-methyl-D-erythritol kinase